MNCNKHRTNCLPQKLQRRLKWIALSLIFALITSSCATASKPASVVECPQIPPLPAEIAKPVRADFLSRMKNFLYYSPERPTK